jgi:hypothetical protein
MADWAEWGVAVNDAPGRAKGRREAMLRIMWIGMKHPPRVLTG